MLPSSRPFLTITAGLMCMALCFFSSCSSGGSGGGGNPGTSALQQAADLVWSTQKLKDAMDNSTGPADPNLIVLDCRKNIPDSTGKQITPYDAIDHIPGSYYINFFDFGDPYPDDPGIEAKIINTLSTLGIMTDTTIVLYDDGIANPMGKVFWNLERLGCTDVHILDGGIPAWITVGLLTDLSVSPARIATVFTPVIDNSIYSRLDQNTPGGALPMKDIFDLVDGGSTDYPIIDYREGPLFDGHKICPDAARHGCMTHSVFLDWHDYFDGTTGLFKSQAEIDQMTRNVGGDPAKKNVVICNKGWRSGVAYFALRYAGWPKSSLIHYVGGIRAWTLKDSVNYPMISDGRFEVGEHMPPGDKSAKRFAGAFCQLGQETYCIGGYQVITPLPASAPFTAPCNIFQSINLSKSTNTWTDLPAMTEALTFAVAGTNTVGDVYVIGGRDSAGALSDKVYKYTASTTSWDNGTVETAMPFGGRWSYVAATIGNEIFICGGLNTTVSTEMGKVTSYDDQVWKYNTDTKVWKQLDSLAQGRRCHAMVAIGTQLYVLGGFYKDLDVGYDLDDILSLDTTNVANTWVVEPDVMPLKLAGHAAAVADSKIYVMGGWSIAGIKFDVIEYDPVTQKANIMKYNGKSAAIGWPRYWCFIGALGKKVATIGGFGWSPSCVSTTQHSGMYHFNQTYIYDLNLQFDPHP